MIVFSLPRNQWNLLAITIQVYKIVHSATHQTRQFNLLIQFNPVMTCCLLFGDRMLMIKTDKCISYVIPVSSSYIAFIFFFFSFSFNTMLSTDWEYTIEIDRESVRARERTTEKPNCTGSVWEYVRCSLTYQANEIKCRQKGNKVSR